MLYSWQTEECGHAKFVGLSLYSYCGVSDISILTINFFAGFFSVSDLEVLLVTEFYGPSSSKPPLSLLNWSQADL